MRVACSQSISKYESERKKFEGEVVSPKMSEYNLPASVDVVLRKGPDQTIVDEKVFFGPIIIAVRRGQRSQIFKVLVVSRTYMNK